MVFLALGLVEGSSLLHLYIPKDSFVCQSQDVIPTQRQMRNGSSGGKASQNKVINLWTFNIPASPHHSDPNQSVFADTVSFQEVSVTAAYQNKLGQRALKIHDTLVLPLVTQIQWAGMWPGHPLESFWAPSVVLSRQKGEFPSMPVHISHNKSS